MAVANEVKARPGSKRVESDGKVERDRLRTMIMIRRFEERTFQEYTKPGFDDPHHPGEKYPRIGGFCHLYNGQEAVAVGIAAVFQKGKDYLINGYRDHGHSIALGMEARPAMAELFGRATGCSKGKGGSMHFFDASIGNMGGHGIVGGQLPLGVGFAFSAWYRKTGGCCFTLFGDGAVNQGTHNEALNLASLYKLPVIFMIENNLMAMGTQVERHSAERDLAKRASGYNMPFFNVDGMDVDVVIDVLNEATARGRKGDGPTYLSMNTYRYRGHSMSDPLKYRSKEEAEKWRQRDPIVLYSARLKEKGLVDDAAIEKMEEECRAISDDAAKFAESSPHPDLSELYTDILAETYPLTK